MMDGQSTTSNEKRWTCVVAVAAAAMNDDSNKTNVRTSVIVFASGAILILCFGGYVMRIKCVLMK